jgi:hypothetical protein
MVDADSPPSNNGKRPLWKWITSGSIIASMCCLPSVILVMFGLASISTAAALSNDMYWGPMRYLFYFLALIFVGFGLWKYFQQQGICTLDEAKKQRRLIINTTLMAITLTIIGYLVFNYLILELLGIAVGLPWEDDAFWNQ